MKEPSDDRSQLALAMEWASRITTVSMEMVIPIVGGYWLDNWCGTEPLFTVAGAVFGLTAGMWHLLRMTRPSSATGSGHGDSDDMKKRS